MLRCCRPWRGETLVEGDHQQEGRTYLIAGMRAYVASKLGETVELP